MKFKFRNRKKQPRVVFSHILSVDDYLYKYALDTRLLNPTLIRDMLDLVPAPEDVLDEDSAESTARLKALAALNPIIEEYSKTTAALILTSFSHNEDYMVSEDEVNDMLTIIRYASYTSSIATVTQLEDLGIIEYKFAR